MNHKIPSTRARATAWLALAVMATATSWAPSVHAADTAPPATAAPAPATPLAIEIVRPITVDTKRVPRVITDWDEGEPIPAGYHPAQRVRRGPIVGGVIPFAILYFISVLVAAANQDASHGQDRGTAGLYVPVVGPFITMTQTSTAVGNVFLAIDGLGQAAGAALVIYGLTSPQTVLVRDDHYGLPRLLPRPMLFGRAGGGFGLSGSF